MITVKSSRELALMRKSGRMSAYALNKVIESARPGVTLSQLDKIAEDAIKQKGGKSSFKTVSGYAWTTCLTVNDEVVHGIPRNITLKKGDVLGIDLGAIYGGYHTDTAWSVVVGGTENTNTNRFLEVGERVLWAAISKAVEGNKIGDISATIQESIEGAGYTVIRSLSGHGVGKSPHEDPEIPGFGRSGTGPKLVAGMTLAIEVIYAQGFGEVYEKEDGWTIATSDGSLGGLFEMSVIVGKSRAEVLTDWRSA